MFSGYENIRLPIEVTLEFLRNNTDGEVANHLINYTKDKIFEGEDLRTFLSQLLLINIRFPTFSSCTIPTSYRLQLQLEYLSHANLHLLFAARAPLHFNGKAKLYVALDRLFYDALQYNSSEAIFSVDFHYEELDANGTLVLRKLVSALEENKDKCLNLYFSTLIIKLLGSNTIDLSHEDGLNNLREHFKTHAPPTVPSWNGKIDKALIQLFQFRVSSESLFHFI